MNVLNLRSILILSCLLSMAGGPLSGGAACGHEGPDPVAQWRFSQAEVANGLVTPRLGPPAKIVGDPVRVDDEFGGALQFDGVQDCLSVSPEGANSFNRLPSKLLTVAAWVRVDRPKAGAGIVSAQQVHAEGQKGWVLGYNERAFRFGLSSRGADDGNGRMTIIEAASSFEPGRYYRVVGVYDGAEMRLYVNGQLEASSRAQNGPIEYGARTTFVIGAAADTDEGVYHRGALRDVSIYDVLATEHWVQHDFEESSKFVAQAAAVRAEEDLQFVVEPYLQYVTREEITVRWETNHAATSRVDYGLNSNFARVAEGPSATLHEVKLAGLEAETPYYYQVSSTAPDGHTIQSAILSFQTANRPETPFAFGVIGDTQFNPKVAKTLSDMLWLQRPNFVMVVGDLVDTGPDKLQWTQQFFPGMQPLISRVALFPVLGNHEQNTKYYYQYMSLPDPEYYYSFKYGNAEFFMLDSNKEVGPGSEQWKWLEKALAQSEAEWKFVAYHHPSYSSDEDDYGDMWRGRSRYGDLRIRQLSKLYDQYNVDIIWNGHIHSYERTWPIKEDKVVEQEGTIYMVTGGGGGGLEVAGPIKPYFQNNVMHGHHYCLVGVNGRTLELKAFDMEGRLFDYLKIDKRTDAPAPRAK